MFNIGPAMSIINSSFLSFQEMLLFQHKVSYGIILHSLQWWQLILSESRYCWLL